MNLNTTLAPQYGKALRWALGEQVALFLLGSIVLDFGETMRALAYGSVAFWIGAGIVIFRRPVNPGKGDLGYVKWGLVFVSIFACFVTPLIREFLGHRF